MPRHKSQIRIGALVTDEVLAAGLLQVRIDHADDTTDLVAVTLEAGVNLLLMIEYEPGALAEVGAYTSSAIEISFSTSPRWW